MKSTEEIIYSVLLRNIQDVGRVNNIVKEITEAINENMKGPINSNDPIWRGDDDSRAENRKLLNGDY